MAESSAAAEKVPVPTPSHDFRTWRRSQVPKDMATITTKPNSNMPLIRSEWASSSETKSCNRKSGIMSSRTLWNHEEQGPGQNGFQGEQRERDQSQGGHAEGPEFEAIDRPVTLNGDLLPGLLASFQRVDFRVDLS